MSLVKIQPARPRTAFNFWHPGLAPTMATEPAVNVVETPQGFRIELAAPGLAKEDFQINIENDLLRISAQKTPATAETDAQYRRREFGYASFRRSFRLPDTVDANNVQATCTNGILRVEIGKKPEAQPLVKTIEIA